MKLCNFRLLDCACKNQSQFELSFEFVTLCMDVQRNAIIRPKLFNANLLVIQSNDLVPNALAVKSANIKLHTHTRTQNGSS